MKKTHKLDAHAVGYYFPDGSPTPRLKLGHLAELLESGSEPVLGWIFVDVDNTDHKRWTEDAAETHWSKIKKIPALKCAGFYQTRGGYRLGRSASEIKAWRAGLEAEEHAWQLELARSDVRARGATLGPGSGFADQLTALALAPAGERLAGLISALHTEEARAPAAAIADDVEHASDVLATLVAEFQAGTWRRRTVALPGTRRGSARETVGVRADGLLVAGDGQAQHVPWSVFTESAADLAQLFKGRLEREYSAAEHRGIVALLRIAAATQVARLVEPALAAEPAAVSDAAAEQLVPAAFEPAVAWATEAGDDELLRSATRERDAALLLVRTLRAVEQERWTAAVTGLERLFSEFGDTLLVLLLSDGDALARSTENEENEGPRPENGE